MFNFMLSYIVVRYFYLYSSVIFWFDDRNYLKFHFEIQILSRVELNICKYWSTNWFEIVVLSTFQNCDVATFSEASYSNESPNLLFKRFAGTFPFLKPGNCIFFASFFTSTSSSSFISSYESSTLISFSESLKSFTVKFNITSMLKI